MCRGVADLVAESSWLHNLFLDLRCPTSKATLAYWENVSAVICQLIRFNTGQTKHMEILDKVALGHIRVLHTPSTTQYVDIFIKGLPNTSFYNFRFSLNAKCNSPDTIVGGC